MRARPPPPRATFRGRSGDVAPRAGRAERKSSRGRRLLPPHPSIAIHRRTNPPPDPRSLSRAPLSFSLSFSPPTSHFTHSRDRARDRDRAFDSNARARYARYARSVTMYARFAKACSFAYMKRRVLE